MHKRPRRAPAVECFELDRVMRARAPSRAAERAANGPHRPPLRPSPGPCGKHMLRGMFTSRDKRTDFSVVIKRRGKPPNPWRWEIYRAGRSTAAKTSSDFFPTMRAAQKAGKDALAEIFKAFSLR
jgi:hypothetical protein